MAKAVETFVAFLKKNDVDTDGIADAIKAKFAQSVIVLQDETISEGFMAVEKAEFDGIQTDMVKWKKAARAAEKRVGELESDLDAASAGDDRWKKAFEKEKANNDKLAPLAKRLMDQQRAAWKGATDKIPDAMKDKFRYPESDDVELSDDDIMHNTEKLAEYTAIGALNLDDPNESTKYVPGAPRVNPSGKGTIVAGKDITQMPAAERMESGFDKT